MKSYTDLEQSRTLAEILPKVTADQTWQRVAIAGANLGVPEEIQYRHNGDMPFQIYSGIGIPCWSLAALLDVLPEDIIENYYVPNLQKENGKYSIAYGNEELLCIADNPIDACYGMILKLHELKIL